MQPVLRRLWLAATSLLFMVFSLQPLLAHAQTQSRNAAKGGYFQNDGPARVTPANLDLVPHAVPQDEPLIRSANRPYKALGMSFSPDTSYASFQARGKASWYGKQFHGRKTSSGERYDMFAMTGAHPTLPIPSYAKVTNLKNGKMVIVRINDRGPFHKGRIMDLSYAAAHQLGFVKSGSADVLVERVFPVDGGEQIATRPEKLLVKSEKPIYLQLGSYSSLSGAQARVRKLSRKLPDHHDDKLDIVNQLGAYRVRMGPFRDANAAQNAAREAAEHLPSTSSIVMS
ncbi:septal ring lytic transglycosylase RlpA family protein [Crenobacter intestini]|uniref:Endolytic peptidoglycan transglycosylase RlpA n=1 Tax=Crenobacter intestini TaxID=2563443 RepID=A0A4T0V351_9NEIS|nr:septal ring lytic transglycosylase RlpA family protein [Crenobacter intestini]TIC86034.1 septal ring lytic transglycosylase RlpA family protein [Crenobacter intestini]